MALLLAVLAARCWSFFMRGRPRPSRALSNETPTRRPQLRDVVRAVFFRVFFGNNIANRSLRCCCFNSNARSTLVLASRGFSYVRSAIAPRVTIGCRDHLLPQGRRGKCWYRRTCTDDLLPAPFRPTTNTLRSREPPNLYEGIEMLRQFPCRAVLSSSMQFYVCHSGSKPPCDSFSSPCWRVPLVSKLHVL